MSHTERDYQVPVYQQFEAGEAAEGGDNGSHMEARLLEFDSGRVI